MLILCISFLCILCNYVCAYVYLVVFVVCFVLCSISSSTLILLVGSLTFKNRLPYNLYCVGGDVKHCSIQWPGNKYDKIHIVRIYFSFSLLWVRGRWRCNQQGLGQWLTYAWCCLKYRWTRKRATKSYKARAILSYPWPSTALSSFLLQVWVGLRQIFKGNKLKRELWLVKKLIATSHGLW